MTMKTSSIGRQAISVREGVRLTAYHDTKGILTIGVGHTSAAGPPAVYEGMKITSTECDEILARDLFNVELAVNDAIRVQISQNAFDACVSLAFNIGSYGFAGSSVVKQINHGNMQVAADDFLMWNKPPEIYKRRQGERAQFLRPDSTVVAGTNFKSNSVVSIAYIQERLNANGANPPLNIDGDLGPATMDAIKKFQFENNISEVGLVGPDTVQKLS